MIRQDFCQKFIAIDIIGGTVVKWLSMRNEIHFPFLWFLLLSKSSMRHSLLRLFVEIVVENFQQFWKL